MVAIVTGSGLGLERSSALVLGSRGQIGSSSLGRGGENIHVNAATGNLVVGNRDEFLIGRGPDSAIHRTYNSLGLMNDENGDNWASFGSQIVNQIGAVSTEGSTIDRVGWDGSVVRYTYRSAHAAYIAKTDSGAYDTLTYSGSWFWQDGASGIREVYAAGLGQRVVERVDRDYNSITYSYSADKITRITTADGNYTDLVWVGNNLSKLETTYTDPQGATKTLTRTRYAYDGSNRLVTVTVDLSPEDNSVADGRVYTTNYTYHGTSKLVASITQTDGSRLDFSYDGSNRVTSFTEWVDNGTSRTTSFVYGPTWTSITDPAGQVTYLVYDGSGQLVRIDEPDNYRITEFIYTANGDLHRSASYDGSANYGTNTAMEMTWYRYDANGNLLDTYKSMPPGYEVKRWTYGDRNQVLTETSFATLDPDGHGGADPTGAMTTRYVYDSENHLRFKISAEGRVTEYLYDGSVVQSYSTVDGAGQVTAKIDYTNLLYSAGGQPTEADMITWRNPANMPDKSTLLRTDYTYDFRGNLTTETAYEKLGVNGNNNIEWGFGSYSRTTYVYDQYGNLLSKLANDGGQAETYAYDGLGRTIRFTDAKGVGTWISYIDAQNRTVTTLSSGLTTTAVYNRVGELVGSLEGRAGLTQEDAISTDINNWTTNTSRTSAGMLDGSPATQISIASGQTYGYSYSSTPVESGHALTWTISIKAAGSSTSQALGIWGNISGWGPINLSSARIISGPGSLVQSQVNGGYFDINNLSTTEATRIEVTRYFTQGEYGYPHLYTYGATGSPGESMIVAAQTITRSRFDTSAFNPALLDINNWGYAGVGVSGAGTIGAGSPATQYVVSTTGQWSGVSTGIYAKAGDAYTTSVSLKAAGGGTSASLGIYGNTTGWDYSGNAISSARIISGPGTLVQVAGGLWNITGLSASQETRIEIIRTFQTEEWGGIYLYPNNPEGWIAGQGVIAGAPSITKTPGSATTYKYDSLGRLRIKTDPVGVRSFYFYDKAGRKIADIDQDGSVTEYKYDAADRLIASIAYASALSAAQVASLFDGYGKPTAVELASIRPAASASDRWAWSIYDKADRLIQTIDAAGASVSHMYDGAGRLVKTTRYANAISAATVEGYKASPPAAFVQAPWDQAVDRTTVNYYDNDGLLLATVDEDMFVTEYVYDKAGRQVETVRYANAASASYQPTGAFTNALPANWGQLKASFAAHATDIHSYAIYDGRGLVVATIDGEGNVTRFAYTAAGDVAQEIRGQQVTANTSYTMANLPAPSGVLETTNYSYDARRQLISRVRLLSGGHSDTTVYSYDSMGNLLSETTSETVSAETRGSSFRYDAKGRMIGELGGIGTASLSTYGPNPTQAQIDSQYIIHGTRYVYDAADRLIQKIAPDGSGGVGNKTLYYYDSDGQLRYEVNALGEVTEYRYSALEDKSDTIIYGTRIAAGTLASLGGGLVNSAITNAVAPIANSVLDSRTQFTHTNKGQLFRANDPLNNLREFAYYAGTGELFADDFAYGGPGYWKAQRYGYNRRGLLAYDSHYLEYPNSAGFVQRYYAYDAFGRLHVEYTNNTDWRYSQANSYDRANRRTASHNTFGQYRHWAYDARSNLISQTDRTGKTTSFAYDLFNRNVTTTTAEGVVSTVRKNAYGQTIQITDGAGRSTSYSYDKNGNLKTVTDAAGTTTKNYDNADRLIEVIDGRGVKTSYTYDAVGRVLTEIRDPGGINATTTYAYDAKGQQISVTDARGTVSSFAYDLKGQKTRIVQDVGGLNIITAYQYRADGKVVRMTEAVGLASERRTDYTYDSMGRLTETRVDPNGLNLTKRNFYDVNDNLVAVTDARGFTTRFVYDRENRQILSVSSQGEVTEIGYDAEGRAIWTRSYVNRIAQATVDGFANEVAEATVRASLTVDAARDRITRSMYDGDGRRAWAIDGEGYATRFVYDGANNIVKTIHYESAVTTANGTSKSDLDNHYGPHTSPNGGDAVTIFGYDNANRLISATDAEGFTESYQYDAAGNRTRVINKLGGITDYVYDNLGRTIYEWVNAAVYNDAGTQTSSSYYKNIFEYDALGNITRQVEAYGLSERRDTLFQYDKLGGLTQKTHGTYQGSYTPAENFVYDAHGNLILYTDPSGAKTYSYYDGDNRKVASVSAVNGSQATFQSWTFDGQGNVATERTWGTLVALPASPGGIPPATPGGEYRETQFVYDRNGRLTERRIANIRTGAWNGSSYVSNAGQTLVVTSVYDAFGNLTQEIDANGNSAYHWYDRNGRAVQKLDVSGYVTTWARDQNGNVTSERRYATQFSGSPGAVSVPAHADDRVTTFTYDKNGRRLTETRHSVSAATVSGNSVATATQNATIAYIYNGLGQVGRKTEANGDATDYAYDNHGRLTWQRDPGIVDHAGVTAYHRTWFFYDGLGNLVRSAQEGIDANSNYASGYSSADARVTRYGYEAGKLRWMADATGFHKYYWYDLNGRLLHDEYYTRTNSAGAATGIWELKEARYDLAGRVVEQWMSVDTAQGRSDVGPRTTYTYNAYGEVIAKSIGGVVQEQFQYDAAGRVIYSTAGDGTAKHFGYDGNGNATAVIASAGADLAGLSFASALSLAPQENVNATYTTYSKRGIVAQVIEEGRRLTAAGALTDLVSSRVNNAFGEITSETDARGFTTDYVYNALGRMTSKLSPQVSVTSENGAVSNIRPTENYAYDISGRLVATQDANGYWTTRVLLAGSGHEGSDAKVTTEYRPDGSIWTTKYDAFGDARKTTDGLGRVTNQLFDKMGRVTQITRPSGFSDNYGYDGLGQRIRHWNSFLGSGDVETTDYDALGRVIATRALGGDVTTTGHVWNGGLATAGLGTFGGWEVTTTFANAKTKFEKKDGFGRLIEQTDLGGHKTGFTYDKAGRLTEYRDITAGPTGGAAWSFTWLNIGRRGTVNAADGGVTSFGYDAAGNILSEHLVKAGTAYKNQTAVYDALGRVTAWADAGGTTVPAASLAIQYDANGNVRYRQTIYRQTVGGSPITFEDWFRYDPENRIVTDRGKLSGTAGAVGTTVVRGVSDPSVGQYGGVDYLYNAAGDRVQSIRTANYRYTGWEYPFLPPGESQWLSNYIIPLTYRTDHVYNGDGQLIETGRTDDAFAYVGSGPDRTPGSVTNARVVSQGFTRDGMGRVTQETGGGQTLTNTWNAKSQLTQVVAASGGTTTTTTFNYVDGSGTYLLGQLGSQTSVQGANTQTVTHSFAWYEGAEKTQTVVTGTGQQSPGTTSFTLDAFGLATNIAMTGGTVGNAAYIYDAASQGIVKTETINSTPYTDVWHRMGGVNMWHYSNRFDPRGGDADTTGSRYTVRGGDTLQSVARAIWGDSDLWYKLAEANGLTASSQLTEGQQLTIPAGVWRSHQRADTFIPYDAGRFMGPTEPSPAFPRPVAGKKCGAFGMILLVVIAAAVAIATSGAALAASGALGSGASFATGVSTVLGTSVAGGSVIGGVGIGAFAAAGAVGGAVGSIVSQGVGVATGIQNKFSWKQAALAGIAGGVGGALRGFNPFGTSGVGGIASDFARGVASNAAVQGISVATGLQKKFDWTGLAVGGVVSTVAGQTRIKGEFGTGLSAAASALAGAATRSLLAGTDFGDNIIAALPDVISATISGIITDAIKSETVTASIASGRSSDGGATNIDAGRARNTHHRQLSLSSNRLFGNMHFYGADGGMQLNGWDESSGVGIASTTNVAQDSVGNASISVSGEQQSWFDNLGQTMLTVKINGVSGNDLRAAAGHVSNFTDWLTGNYDKYRNLVDQTTPKSGWRYYETQLRNVPGDFGRGAISVLGNALSGALYAPTDPIGSIKAPFIAAARGWDATIATNDRSVGTHASQIARRVQNTTIREFSTATGGVMANVALAAAPIKAGPSLRFNGTGNAGVEAAVLQRIALSERKAYLDAKFGRTGNLNDDINLRGYMSQVENLDVSSTRGKAIFYSGPGNRGLAEAFARSGGTTLEMTAGGAWLDNQALFNRLPGELAIQPWERLSQRYAQDASGSVSAFIQGAHTRGVFYRVELPALQANPNVNLILRNGNQPIRLAR